MNWGNGGDGDYGGGDGDPAVFYSSKFPLS